MAGDPKVEIEKALREALGQIAPEHADFPFVFERPKQASHGDFSSSVALQLAKQLKKNPRELAQSLANSPVFVEPQVARLIDKPEIAGPGFINFRLKVGAKLGIVSRILREGAVFGTSQSQSKGTKVQVEFVSA